MLLIINQIFIPFVCFNHFVSPNGEHSNVSFSTTAGPYPKSSPVKYSYLSSSLDYHAELLAASLFKSH